MRAGSTFAVADTVTLGPGGAGWTRSLLSHSVLLPVNPQLLRAGLTPFDASATAATPVAAENWHRDVGTERFTNGFYWLLPVTEAEHARANTQGTWNVFADLVESSLERGGDEFAVAYDLLR